LSRTPKVVRQIVAFLLNFLVASLGTQLLTAPFDRALRSADVFYLIVSNDVLSGVAAFGLGWFVYRTRKSAEAKWIWVAGLCLFSYGAIHFALGQSSFSVLQPHQGHSLSWEMSGFGCRSDVESCRDWGLYTLQLLRTLSYSLGAACCARFRSQHPGAE
jgi:hypothetical protein